MPNNQQRRIPKYRHYKPKNLGVVRINGIDEYLGKFNTEESLERYHRRIAEWLGNTEAEAEPSPKGGQHGEGPAGSITVGELILAYWQFAKTYYSKQGQPTQELNCMREAIRPLRQLYAHSKASEFGPRALKAVRQHMVKHGISRGVTNRRVGRIKRIFKWAVAEELVPPSVLHGLQAVSGLRYGRTEARETERVKPVPQEYVFAVLPYVSPQVAAMIQLQWLTGMRSCEVVAMRPADINMAGDVWIYEPYDHKNRWRGHDRKIPLGPKAQEILKPFLSRQPFAFLFSPREAEQWRLARRRKERKTPMTPSQAKRRPKSKPKRKKRHHYDTASYKGAIDYGLAKANQNRSAEEKVPHWFPLQIRHSRATEVRRLYGLDAAQAALGHARANVTEVYAEKNLELATRIAKEMG